MQPDWFEALNDADTDVNSSKKRLSKSLSKSLTYLTQCVAQFKDSKVKQHYYISVMLKNFLVIDVGLLSLSSFL